MALTRLQLVTNVANTLHRLSTAELRDRSTTLSTQIVTWLNFAQNRIVRDASRLHGFEFSSLQDTQVVSFTQGTGSGALPTGTKAIKNFKVTTSGSPVYLRYIPSEDFDKIIPDPANREQGTPLLYTMWSNQWEVYPVPNQAYAGSLRRSKYPTELAADSSTSDLLYMDDVIIAYATAIGYEFLRENEDATHWYQVATNLLAQSVEANVHNTTPTEGIMIQSQSPEGQA